MARQWNTKQKEEKGGRGGEGEAGNTVLEWSGVKWSGVEWSGVEEGRKVTIIQKRKRRERQPSFTMVNIPKTKKTFCANKICKKHVLHKVTQYKKGKDSLYVQGTSVSRMICDIDSETCLTWFCHI